MEKKKRKYSRTDRLILGIGFTILGLFVLSIAIPIIYVVLASFMDPTVLNNQGLSSDIKDCKFCSNGTPILKSAVHSF